MTVRSPDQDLELAGVAMAHPVRVRDDVFTDEFFADPHRVYARLRAEAPVHNVVTPNQQKVWLVVGHAAARMALADPRLSKDVTVAQRVYERHTDPSARDRDFAQSLNAHMLNTDPPEHTRLRKLVAAAFSPRIIEDLRPRIADITSAHADELRARLDTTGSADLLDAIALPVPTAVICELLGIPEPARDVLRSAIADLLSIGDPAKIDRASQTLAGVLMQTLEEKKSNPGRDLLTGLMTAQDGDDRLTGHEMVSMAMLLLVAGHETTVNLVGNGMRALLENPASADELRSTPELIPAAVEELLRYDGPTSTVTFRFTTDDVELDGVTVPAEHPVVVSPLAANRDPARFPNPDVLDIRRDTSGAIPFGHGIHHCLGAALGRMEAVTIFETLLTAVPDLALDTSEPLVYRRSMLVNGLESLPVGRLAAR
ncbi:cytochrome P450 [Pseudonocardia nematodicida]|uniref:Cytochrome P450 n=1 Tax=Pseudonocardia nematodicida TaxID=1206997 RepID=A0ABV1KHN7_9PSEU